MQYEYKELLTESQIEDLFPLCKAQHAHAYPHLKYDVEAVRATFQFVLKDTSRTFLNVFICYRDGEAIGYALCSRNKYYFNEGYHGHLDMWYVHPAYRATRAAVALIKKYEQWARLLGCIEVWTSVGTPNVIEASKTCGVLNKLGYDPMGEVLTKRIVA